MAHADYIRWPRRDGLSTQVRNAEADVASMLVLATIGLAVAGFNVMAQRRLRALGVLSTIGASDTSLPDQQVPRGRLVNNVQTQTSDFQLL